jgi:hypothetical protein
MEGAISPTIKTWLIVVFSPHSGGDLPASPGQQNVFL